MEYVSMGKAEAALLTAVDGATKSWKRKLSPFFGSPLRAGGCKKCYVPTSTELGNLTEQERFRKWMKLCEMIVKARDDRLLGKPVEDEEMQKKIDIAERLLMMVHDPEIEGKTPFDETTTPFEVIFMLFKSESEAGGEYSTFDWKEYEASKLAAVKAAKVQNATGPAGT
ncbi:MAG: hypothetical protein Q9228_006019 [Teloschistes exilis]